MATKTKTKNEKTEKKVKSEEAKAKAKARKEALKNRPAVQRTNSKQLDVIEGDGYTVKTFGYPIKLKRKFIGILVTSVTLVEGKAVSESTTFIPGEMTVKTKKGHGFITYPKSKDKSRDEEDAEDVEDAGESEEEDSEAAETAGESED